MRNSRKQTGKNVPFVRLTEGEEVYAVARLNCFIIFFPVVLLGLLSFAIIVSPANPNFQDGREDSIFTMILLFIISLVYGIIKFKTTYMVITNKRLLGRAGLIVKRQITSTSRRIDAVVTIRDLLGLIFRFAHVRIYVGNAVYTFFCIENYREIEDIINATIINAQNPLNYQVAQ